MQLPLFDTPSTWKPTLDLPSWRGAKRVAFDCEARDPDLRSLGSGAGRRPGSYVVGWSFAIEDGPAAYLPIRHEGGGNLPIENVVRYLRDQAAEFDGDLIGANLPYDLDFSATEGIGFEKVRKFRDVLIAEPLIDELQLSYSLESVAARWGLEGKRESVMLEAARNYGLPCKTKGEFKANLWRLPARHVGEYAEQDSRLPLQISRRQERRIDEDDLWKVYDLESDLLPILFELRRSGIRIDLERLTKLEAWALREESAALAEVHRQCNVRIAVGDVMKSEVVADALVRIGWTPKYTSKGLPNIDKFVLAGLQHPVASAIEWARKTNKLRSTFAASIREHLTPDGRIHCTYNQLRKQKDDGNSDDVAGAAYGRLSCEHPNLQQQPARDEFAAAWRSIYLPEEGDLWSALDLSQQEPRMAIHYACISRSLIGDTAWDRAILARDQYRNDPSTDNHQMMADMAGIKRKFAKQIFLGLAYGMGGAKLCRQLGLPTRMVVRGPMGILVDADSEDGKILQREGARRFEAAGPEGQALLDKFNERVPFIRATARACERRAKQYGFVRTLSGRRCHFPRDLAGNVDWTHKAFNRVIQGSSADQIKMAMVALWRAGIRMLVQVHDEIGISARTPEQIQQAVKVMLECCPLEVPSKVDDETGPSWGVSMLEAARTKGKKDPSAQKEYESMRDVFVSMEVAA